MKSRRGGLIRIALMASFVALQSVYAATFTVSSTADSGPGSLRTALSSVANGDTINFSLPTPSTITLASTLSVFKNISIIGPGPDNLTLNGNNAVQVLQVIGVNVPVAVTISGLTITNGNAGNTYAGGILNYAGNLTLNNCRVTGNKAHRGGGIVNLAFTGRNTVLQINDSVVSNNISSENGGGIFNWAELGPATLVINNSTVSGNQTINAMIPFYSGGGIYNFSPDNGSVQITDSTISGNFASTGGVGGAIFNDSGSLVINNSTLSGNGAGNGGGAVATGSARRTSGSTIINSTLSGNSCSSGGGAIQNFGNLVIQNSTLSGNTASQGFGGGIYNAVTVYLANTILNGGGATTGANIFNAAGGTVTSGGYNLSSDSAAQTLGAPSDKVDTDPLLGALQNNGGPTLTHALSAGSPAIDAGDPNFTSATVVNDQRGPGFARVAGGRLDIGAFEVQGTTPTGTNVVAQPVDSNTGTDPVTLTFSSVTQQGTTALTTSSSGPATPAGFSLGNPPTYYELSTTAVYSGAITICIDYSGVSFTSPMQLALFHYEGGAWVDVTTPPVDTAHMMICGSVTSLSPFAIFNKTCGNGVVDAGEQCDDGLANGTPQDCCSATCTLKSSGTTCDDGDACTQTDQCNATGACVGSNPVSCQAQDVCHSAGTCAPETGACSNPAFDPIAAILSDPVNVATDLQAVQCLIFELSNGQVPAVP